MTQQDATENVHIAELRKVLPPGSTVYTILRNVSRSGMSRTIEPVIIRDNEPCGIPYFEEITGYKMDPNRDGFKIGGAGMDMGFAMVYRLSNCLYPNGFECIGDNCPASDHVNGDQDRTPHNHRNGGYALKQRWL